MSDTKSGSRKLFAQLKESYESIPWQERREAVKLLATAISEGDRSEVIMDTIEMLTVDPKWEVRSDVADLLSLLPEDHFVRAAAMLSEDTNVFVRRAAERAMDRRRRGQRIAHRTRLGFDQAESQYAVMEKLYGKTAADKARRMAELLLDVIVGAIVHEMRGVLTPLKAGTACLLQHLDGGTVDPAECRRILVKVMERTAFLERLLDDMRSYSQALPSECRCERLWDIVTKALCMVEENLEANGRNFDGIQVQLAVPQNITLEIARHQVLVAIKNVAKNAFEAFDDGTGQFQNGQITISAQVTEAETVEITIEDTGMGINVEDLEEIRQFIPGKTTKKNRGTGFGLPIARRHIQSHGGSISIESHENEGTKITITLPLERQGDDDHDVQGSRS